MFASRRIFSVILVTLLACASAASATQPRFWKVEVTAPARVSSGLPIPMVIAAVPTQENVHWMTGSAPVDAAQIEASVRNAADGKVTRLHLANGVADDQRAPLHFNPITNGAEFQATPGVFPPGRYIFTLRRDPAVQTRRPMPGFDDVTCDIEVVDDPNLRRERVADLATSAKLADPFSAFLGSAYGIPEVMDVLLAQLASEDDKSAAVAARNLRYLDRPPEGLPAALAKALDAWATRRDAQRYAFQNEARVELCMLAAHFYDVRYVPSLTQLTKDRDPRVCAAAAEALKQPAATRPAR